MTVERDSKQTPWQAAIPLPPTEQQQGPAMTITNEKIEEARRWLKTQHAVVHPGTIETIMRALDMAAENVSNNAAPTD